MLSACSAGPASGPSLLCRLGTSMCALAVSSVDEVMRPLPIERVTRGPSFVLGLSVIRGQPTPVISLAALLGDEHADEDARLADPLSPRFVVLRVADRRVALAVDGVLCVRVLPQETLAELPPLFREKSAALIAQVGVLDAELLLVLNGLQLVPDEVWRVLDEVAS